MTENYSTYTNSELEDELNSLEKEYKEIQESVVNGYSRMLELSRSYGEAKNMLDSRTGRKKA